MRELTTRFEEAFRQLGVQLGHEIAALITEGASSSGGDPRAPSHEASGRPAILPGLTGRRRRPGEAPPLCGRFGCDRVSRTRGYCQTHYVQWLKAGEGRSTA